MHRPCLRLSPSPAGGRQGWGLQAMENQATSRARDFAKSLRREMTDGERLLWQRIRGEQLGVKFRRQHPLGAYVADFACLVPMLIVEIDGSQHVNRQAYDNKRDEFFKCHGFEVMRFPANLPFSNLQSIVEAIYNRVNELAALAPIPTFPQRGKEQEESAPLLPPLGEGRDGGSPVSKFSL
jgi:very-short-patch-repair endonuclease